MSFQAMAEAMKIELPTFEKMLVLVMANYADDQLLCWPSMDTLARDTGMARRTVQNNLKKLEDRSLLIIKVGEGRANTNLYQLNFSKENVQDMHLLDDQRVQETTQRVQQLHPLDDQGVHLTTQRVHQRQERVQQLHPNLLEPINKPIKKKIIKNKSKCSGMDFSTLPENISIEVAQGFIDHRKAMKSPLTQRSFELSMADAARAQEIGMTPDEVIDETMKAGWKGINLEWIRKRCATSPVGLQSPQETSLEDRLNDTSWAS